MNFALLGKKIGMSQVFDDENNVIPVTIVEAGPCTVTQIKTLDKEGYTAVQIGYNPSCKKAPKSKPLVGHCKKNGVDPQAVLSEFRTPENDEYETGHLLTVDKFEAGEKVDVVATTKGKGFQGVVKRWNFAGGPASHGSMFHRRGGSYGLCQWPGHVFKNKKMPGHMGSRSRTVQNLKVIKVLPEKHVILVKGSIPGHNGSLLTVRPAIKRKSGKGVS
ncbi:MAG: 50S ribosomal protein L3 [Opitutae bacterium]|jgi:large subunit ribosomal protein L3|nr:50S ribosomal protein L3 [Opitutae bacterium]|tara:strand:- start:4966 stop:5619 length:654 start_codon:yes stop_codon:yes gene_type:complete